VTEAAGHVVAGILRDESGRVLVAQRLPGKHLAGLWEFPGGKCEPGESAGAALRRELHEELGIEVGSSQPLIAVPWHYPGKSILLDVYEVPRWQGTAHGREGQALRWASMGELATLPMPPADRPVVAALRLPPHYPISPEPDADHRAFLCTLHRVLDTGEKCIQLRAKQADVTTLRALLPEVRTLVARAGASVLVNTHIDLAAEFGLGVHLPADLLLRTTTRPLSFNCWVAASCHDARELAHAAAIGVDFVVLGPVLPTASHAGAAALGWNRFAELCAQAPFPVYALGGLTQSDLPAARSAGAQGIAGISAFWPAG
jgi:8-oxo-dGTP diphosphatase